MGLVGCVLRSGKVLARLWPKREGNILRDRGGAGGNRQVSIEGHGAFRIIRDAKNEFRGKGLARFAG